MKTDNELIAEFMGGRVAYVSYGKKDVWVFPFRELDGGADELLFDREWNWLMPVVEKIENIRHIGIDAIYFKIQGHQCQIWTYFDIKEFLRLTGDDRNDENKFKVGHSGTSKIDATYHAIIDFIKWYNQKSK